MARLDSFLRMVADQGASDLHFHSGSPPIVRHDGDLIRLPFRELSRDECRRFIFEILSTEQKNEFDERKELDFLYELKDVARFRTNLLEQSHGMGAVFRVIPNTMPQLDEMMLPPIVRRLTQHQNGLILVCGPTGSGKTTTLAAMVNEINVTSQRHIITIEDPIEFVHPRQQSIVTQRQVGVHCDSFAGALRSALREAPDVLVLGEMRDMETIMLALSAAETGILVFGTLHTNSAAKAVDRIIDAVPDEAREQVRGVLSILMRGVMAQQLCKKATSDGRVAGVEVLLQNFAVSNMIRENKLHQLEGYLQTVSTDGTGAQSLDHSLFLLAKEGTIELEEALGVAAYPSILRKRFEELPPEPV